MADRMRAGPVLDLRNFRDYTERFERCLEEPLGCAEVHLVHADVEGESCFLRAMENSGSFFRRRGLRRIAYHLLDDVINDLILHDLLGGRPEFSTLIPGREPGGLRDRLRLLLQGTAAASEGFGGKVIAVVHEGVYFRTEPSSVPARAPWEKLRNLFFSRIGEWHAAHFPAGAAGTDVHLENSPPFRGSNPEVQHFTDQLISDIVSRLTPSQKMVFDVSHSFLCRHLSMQSRGRHPGLDLALESGGLDDPANDYAEVEAAGAFVGWVHLNDCTAAGGHREGLSLFQEGSLVDWARMVAILREWDAPLVLEIASAERDFMLLETSLRNLQNMWGSPAFG